MSEHIHVAVYPLAGEVVFVQEAQVWDADMWLAGMRRRYPHCRVERITAQQAHDLRQMVDCRAKFLAEKMRELWTSKA